MTVVSVVDDDAGVLDAIRMLLGTQAYTVACYSSAGEFLAAPFQPGCVISDLRMPGLNGLELLAAMKTGGDSRPVILLTAHGDVEIAVRALKQGAADFIEKPFDEERLLTAVALALESGTMAAQKQEGLLQLRKRYDSLTKRQRDVFWLLVAGCQNKEVASRLGISIRTVETYRAWVLERMQTKTLADLVRASITLEFLRDESTVGADLEQA